MRIVSLSALFLLLAACGAPADDDGAGSASEDLVAGRVGAVFTLSNDATANEVLVWRRAADGSLQAAARYGTTGRGSGDGLGSQGALTFSTDRRYLFAVNAGSNELSVFRVKGESLYLVDTVPTGGVRPVSVTEHGGLVYVVHGGGVNDGIAGFVQRYDGTLAALPGSMHALSGDAVGPAEIAFSPSGRALIVTEKGTNQIDEFRIGAFSGRPLSLDVHASNGETPFGFAVDARGQVIVSEAFGGADGASAVSSYQLDGYRGLSSVSASVPDTEGAACWVVLKGERAFVSNTKSGSISTYSIAADGTLTLTAARAADTGDGSKPSDMAISKNGRFLYVLDGGTHAIGVRRLEEDGSLSALADVSGLPPSAAGLAAQ